MVPNSHYLERQDSRLSTPVYYGRREALTDVGDFFVPPWQPGVVVMLTESGPRALVNVCRHRQAIILTGRGNISGIRCPMHGWAWDLDGRCTGHPGFEDGKDLLTLPLQEKGGWMYAPDGDFGRALEKNSHLMLSGFVPIERNAYDYDCSWMEILEVFLENHHVPFVHPGLQSWLDCPRLEAELGDGWSVHTVPFKDAGKKTGLTGTWWKIFTESAPESIGGAVHWSHIFPNIFIENYDGCFLATVVMVPNGEGATSHEEVWVRRDLAGNSRLVKAFLEMFKEVECEDETLIMGSRKGREAMRSLGLEDAGPYQDPTEKCMEHFHKWLSSEDTG